MIVRLPVAAVAQMPLDSRANSCSSISNEEYRLVVAVPLLDVFSVFRLDILSFLRAQDVDLFSLCVLIVSSLFGLGLSVVKLPDCLSLS